MTGTRSGGRRGPTGTAVLAVLAASAALALPAVASADAVDVTGATLSRSALYATVGFTYSCAPGGTGFDEHFFFRLHQNGGTRQDPVRVVGDGGWEPTCDGATHPASGRVAAFVHHDEWTSTQTIWRKGYAVVDVSRGRPFWAGAEVIHREEVRIR